MFIVDKYKNKWAVFDSITGVWYFAKGKANCEQLATELNKQIKGGAL